ncbi:DeoR/GlpR transcriptional regulator [Nakamurella flavida]|uniref:DeoR/GlpR transcriptional regulator n=1 Tax=Nakamurella flavida TaxID=363630 RepID=A0A939C4C2_9ACTN|nr:DeoR/GlpR family DNA-binding transcription regulator [Nakamurella flavida]MBM9475082.1 DeoR/GlpR transcriptional regulator [Nakamurella flavida]MDP9776651.1 DeoR/GlpR family transcriptional regulator of sugar metabolism [Nakamurella flavida]
MGTTDARGQADRRAAILRTVFRDGFARIDDLVGELGVSLMTVHRDLDALATQGYLTKVRGRATANPAATLQIRVAERIRQGVRFKTAIAARAAQLLAPGQTIHLDDSTTALALAPHLARLSGITVATNFAPLVAQLADAPGIELIVIGGRYNRVQEASFGARAVESIDQIHADLAFLSTTGVRRLSCYHPSEETVETRKAFMRNARRSVLLVDHVKFGRPAPHLLCPLTAFDLVISDSELDPEERAELTAAGVHLETAPV